jgi:hypothetical protein
MAMPNGSVTLLAKERNHIGLLALQPFEQRRDLSTETEARAECPRSDVAPASDLVPTEKTPFARVHSDFDALILTTGGLLPPP